MSEKREIDTRKNIRVVTSNSFITACGLENISLKARKLLYLAISQCRQTDKEFFEYTITVPAFAELMGISPSHVYEEADKLTDELMKGFVRIDQNGGKDFRKYQLFDMCEYHNASIRFEISQKMTDFLLELKGSFTKPLLEDFIKMKSPYSIAIWHLMQREMHSKKPGVSDKIKWYLSLAELREVTGTQNKLKQVGQFKERVLDKALREIADNCGVNITYENVKVGHTITGFHFTAISPYHISENEITPETQDKVTRFNLEQKAKVRSLNSKEQEDRKN